ncbi:MAG: Gfo/Idh/MocA family protein [Rhodothermales bacterium]
MKNDTTLPSGFTRRDFVKTSATAALGVSAGLMARPNYAYAAGSDTIRVGLVGCGGRGTGAARDAVTSTSGVELVAMGDLFEDRMEQSKGQLKENIGEAFKVTDDATFIGFDAYQNVIDSDVDLVILATPPGFRPIHVAAAVEAGKHLFIEKPVAVDTAGIRSIMESAKKAEAKNLAIVAGTQRRHDPKYIEAMKRIHDGQMGEVVAGQVYWNQGGLWNRERLAGMSDAEWQIRNWLYFTWLSGDHIVEQHVHNIDVANWALQAHPVQANGVGGRQVRVDPSYGHIFDHFGVEIEYPSGARILSMCRQQDGTARYVGEYFIGTKGTSDGSTYIRGENAWRHEAEEGEAVNPYVQEHTDLIASIREGSPLNEGQRIAESVLTAIMAREAAYTGQVVTWEDILNADLDLVPKEFAFGPMPMPPVPEPGVTTLNRSVVPKEGTETEAVGSAN